MPPRRPVGPAARLARFGFADAGKAAHLLGPDGLDLWDPAQGPADEHMSALLGSIAAAADPDLALRQLCRLLEAEPAGEVLPALSERPALRRRLLAVLGASTALGDHIIASRGEWRALDDGVFPTGRRDAAAIRTALLGAVAERTGRAAVTALRVAYRRALVCLAAADLTGERDVEEVAAELSDLADATLATALAVARADLPDLPDVRLAVVAMGKCGGRELNYVSDVDVIFVAETEERLFAAARLARRLMEVCLQVAWPVDAALRPEGRDGPLVRTLASHVAYYQKWARTWEFQALLKARPAAGDLALGGAWLDAVRPLVWQAADRPGVVDDVRAMRRRVEAQLPARDADREIKRGPGGLRDVEFAVQLLQLVHGRADVTLRSPSTLDALRALTAGGYVGRVDGEAFAQAYRFLRTVEHRLQLQRLRRTHTIPDDPAALRWLAHACGYRSNQRRDAVEAFRDDWSRHARQARRLHEKLLYRPLLEAVASVPSEGLRLAAPEAQRRLEFLGFADPAGALRHIQALTDGLSRRAAIQRTLLPVLLSEFADAPEPDRGLLAYRQVSEKLGHTPWYLRLLRDEGPVALRLARILGTSSYVVDLLARDPEALRLLADDNELVPRPPDVLAEGLRAAAARHAEPASAVAAVRALRRRELFRIACADLLGLIDVVTIGRALAELTDAVLAATLHIAAAGDVPLAVIGMGRLGGAEMSYASDADVLFVCDSEGTAGPSSVAEALRKLLTAPAPDPPLGIDADLRPEGRQGPLVRSLAAYGTYYARWAGVWEAQALLRARFVAGDAALAARFLALADRFRYPTELTAAQVTEIRRIKARVDNERLPRAADPATHTKLGRGGLADVEWTVQLLQLRHAREVPGLRTCRTLDALAAAGVAGLLADDDVTALRSAWLLASRVRNAMTLVRGRPSDQLPRRGTELAGVVRALGGPAARDPGEFLDEYLRTARRARQAVERVFYGTGPDA